MYGLISFDNQPIESRWGGAIWLTDLITPKNPSVQLKYEELTRGIDDQQERVMALWRYVSHQPYKEAIPSTLVVGGRSIHQDDTWFFPSETIAAALQTNCANRSFLLASLLKNEYPLPGQVYCSVGHIAIDGIGNHAWVTVDAPGGPYIVETTQPNLDRAFIPMRVVTAYAPALHFDEEAVYVANPAMQPAEVLNHRFGVCAIAFLERYLAGQALHLDNPS